MWKKRFRLVVLIAVSLGLVAAIVFWLPKLWMAHPKTAKNAFNGNSVGLDEAEGVTMIVPGSTPNTYWKLRIHQIQSAGDIDNFSQVEGVYFINKAPFYQMSGKRGVLYLKTRKLEIAGNVILKATDGSKKLTAARLFWDTENDKVIVQQDVVLETTQATVTTEEIVTNQKMGHAVFNGQTKVLYQGTNP